MSFMKPKYETASNNVNQKLVTDTYSPQAQQGVTSGNYLSSLLTGTGDTAAANAGYQGYLDNAGYENALNQMSRSVVGGGAASGLLRSGATSQALLREGAKINKGYFDNYLQSLGGMAELGQGAGQLLVGAGSGENKERPRTAGIIAGLGGKLLGGIFSDRRLKENIVPVGTYPNGLPMYEFNYKGGEQRMRGVMSDDVRQKYPEAVDEANGFDVVHYDMLGIEMETVA